MDRREGGGIYQSQTIHDPVAIDDDGLGEGVKESRKECKFNRTEPVRAKKEQKVRTVGCTHMDVDSHDVKSFLCHRRSEHLWRKST